jgi:hypothetical protein
VGLYPLGGQIYRYILLLFLQLENYTLPKVFENFLPPDGQHRIDFDGAKFMEAAGLGGPVAANYFTVEGATVQERSQGITGLALMP